MMGAIVLTMLLGWLAVAAALTVFSGGREDLTDGAAHTTGAPRLTSEES